MAYVHISLPEEGEKISTRDHELVVPDNPILGYIEGDGIGPDIMRASLRVWNAAVDKAYGGKRKIYWTELLVGEKAAEAYNGDIFPEETRQALRDLIISIKGPITTPVGSGFRSLNVTLRQDLDLYACVRPVRYYAGVPSPLRAPEKVDVVVFRENTEDVYCGIEYRAGSEEARKLEKFLKEELGAEFFPDSGIGIKPISSYATKRLVRKAIQYAIDHGRESVTVVHKGNIMKYTEGAFRTWAYEVAREEFGEQTITEEELHRTYGGKRPQGKVVIKDRIADIMFQMMLLRPDEFDVIVTPNLNGDYLSDAVAAEVGGVGIAPGANIGDYLAVFEATHGSAPKYANQDKVNPSSLLFSGVMMLEYLGWKEAADLISEAYPEVIKQKVVTYDFARNLEGATEVSTSGFADAIIRQIMEAEVDLAAVKEKRREAVERERREREARRISRPVEEMLASGRTPHTVGDIMSRIISVSPEETVRTTLRLMRDRAISSILAEPGDDGQWAIMTQRDVVMRIVNANRSPDRVKVGDVASKPLLTVPPETPLYDCSTRMIEWGVRRLVVQQDDKPIGIVSDTDIFRIVDEFGWTPE